MPLSVVFILIVTNFFRNLCPFIKGAETLKAKKTFFNKKYANRLYLIFYNRNIKHYLFEKKIFKKEKSVYASFKLQQDTFWGRKIRYSVNEQPFSVMEVFLF